MTDPPTGSAEYYADLIRKNADGALDLIDGCALAVIAVIAEPGRTDAEARARIRNVIAAREILRSEQRTGTW